MHLHPQSSDGKKQQPPIGIKKRQRNRCRFYWQKEYSPAAPTRAWGYTPCRSSDLRVQTETRQRISPAFPVEPLQQPVTCFRRKRICSTITATESGPQSLSRAGPKTCPGFSPDSLVQQNKNACPAHSVGVAHAPQKPEHIQLWRSFPTSLIHHHSIPGCAICQDGI